MVQGRSAGSREVLAERELRLEVWAQMLAEGPDDALTPGRVRDLGAHEGAQGIWVDKS